MAARGDTAHADLPTPGARLIDRDNPSRENPADPMDTPQHDIRLAPVKPDQRGLVRQWLHRPEIWAFWGTASAAEAEVAVAWASPGALCRLIVAGDEPIGYAHALDCGLLGSDQATAVGPGTWDCAVFVALESHRGQGTGSLALGALVDEVFATTLALACVIRVPVRREAAVRAIEAAGFQWVRIDADPALGPVWVMRVERPGH